MAQREHLIRAIEAKFLDLNPPTDHRRACLWWAVAACWVLRDRGHRALIQGGSAFFRAVDPSLDDGHSPTHYSYVWDATLESKALELCVLGLAPLPEVHFWVGVDHRGRKPVELVDFTTRYLPELAAAAGIGWTMPQPPEYHWGHKYPNGWAYEATPMACIFGEALARQIVAAAQGQESTLARIVYQVEAGQCTQ